MLTRLINMCVAPRQELLANALKPDLAAQAGILPPLTVPMLSAVPRHARLSYQEDTVLLCMDLVCIVDRCLVRPAMPHLRSVGYVVLCVCCPPETLSSAGALHSFAHHRRHCTSNRTDERSQKGE